MAMLSSRQDVELLATIRPVTVPHQPQLLEDIEGAVHRRWDGRGITVAAALHQVGGRDVAVGLREDLDDGPTLRRPAQAAPT